MSWFKRREMSPFEIVQFRHRKHPILMAGDRRLAYFNSEANAREFAVATDIPYTDLKEW